MPKPSLLLAALFCSFAASTLCATETENQGLRVLPTPGPVAIDGQTNDWDLSGGIFACGELEHLRDNSSVWFHAMYDSENLYLLARWKDPTPLNNPESLGGHGFNGDCLQFRCILFPDTPEKTITWWDAWRDNHGLSVIERSSPGAREGAQDNNMMPALDNACELGGKMAFHIDADGKGYSQEIALPWKMLSPAGRAPKVGERFKITIEPNFTAGTFGRITIKDIFADDVKRPNKIFTFNAYKDWGWATLVPKGKVDPQPVRVGDGRTFPVSMREGLPTVDWTGLVRRFEWPGFKAITFDMPFSGYVSLNLVDPNGVVVRHLLNQDAREKGPVTVQWDGLTDPTYRTPGQPVPAGDYTWKAIAHPGVTLDLRGWASFSGRAPWWATPYDFWLGDHGVPSAVVTDGERMYLACNGAEGGRHLIATDFDGKLIWSLQNTTGGADPEVIAVDRGIVYVVHAKSRWLNKQPPVLISRVDAQTGAYQPWKNRKNHIVSQEDVFGANFGADRLSGLDARDGLLYGTTGDSTIFLDEIADWQVLLSKVAADASLATVVLADLRPGVQEGIERYLAGKQRRETAMRREDEMKIVENLNGLLKSKTLTIGAANDGEAKRALANRRALEERLAPALRKVDHQFVVLDGATGAMLKHWPLPMATAIKVRDAKTAYVICGEEVRTVNLDSGDSRPFITGLRNPYSLSIDPQGRILVGLRDPESQIVIFGTNGKEIGRVGEKGGRQIGPWQPKRILNPSGIAVDAKGKLWVTEHDAHPKRVSVWAYGEAGAPIQTKLLKEYFGPTHYGAGGGTINPRDPDVMVGEGCEWRIDPKGGSAACLGTFDTKYHEFATFREGTNGKLYLFTNTMRYGNGAMQIWERLGDARYALRATMRNDVKAPDAKIGATELWIDQNGDGQVQPEEIQRRIGGLSPDGSNDWSMNLGPDMTLYAFDWQDKKLKALHLEGFTSGGAPRYDLSKLNPMPDAMSVGYQFNQGCALPSADNKTILMDLAVKNHPAGRLWHCFDLASGKLLWTYPNPYFQVHGSHNAPTSEPGLFRGAFGPVGTGYLPGVGNFWAINGNLGEWWVLSSEGFFVSRLFSGNVFDWNWPANPLPGSDLTNLPPGGGSEDFGGSLTQAKDGKIYIQAGKAGLWNVAVNGLEKIVPIPGGKVQISQADTTKALAMREAALQDSAGGATLAISKSTVGFSGDLEKDFKGIKPISYQKSEDASVRTALAYDDAKLYIGWQVKDATPWVNGAQDISQMYSCGDTVDLQLGTDPAADPKRSKAVKGDLRLSIGNYKGKPTAVLYRFVSDLKKPRTFSSGVVQGWQVDWVDVVAEAEIKVTVDAGKGYLVEAAIPLDVLGLKPTPKLSLRGDVGVTHGDPAGNRTRLRTYWSNQQTGLVDDVVFELQPEPRNWGEFTF